MKDPARRDALCVACARRFFSEFAHSPPPSMSKFLVELKRAFSNVW